MGSSPQKTNIEHGSSNFEVEPNVNTNREPRTRKSELLNALRSPRTLSVALLSFSSGLPLGLVWYAIPDWMRDIGVDIRVVGLFTLAQAPWAFKVIWSPLMDRYVPPFWGRRRGWMAVTQIALAVLGLMLAGVGERPEAIWVVGALALAIAIASASQDIAIDAYAVEVLRKDEQGAAVGARTGRLSRGDARLGRRRDHAGRAASAGRRVNALLALRLPADAGRSRGRSPEPEVQPAPPRDAARRRLAAVRSGCSRRPRALEILAFVVLYKLADQLDAVADAPVPDRHGLQRRPSRHRAGDAVGWSRTIVGAFIGGWVTTLAGLGHSLWIFGVLQIFSNVGYFLLAVLDRPNLAADVRRDRLRAPHVGPGDGRLLACCCCG